jgi:hypothetical protein
MVLDVTERFDVSVWQAVRLDVSDLYVIELDVFDIT